MVRSLAYALTIVVFIAVGGTATGQTLGQAAAAARKGPAIDPAFRADIELLMDVTGSSATAVQMASAISDAFLNNLKERQNSVPPRVIEVVRDVFNTEFQKAFTGSEMRDQQIALYASYLTHDDVKGLLAFYRSDVGKKAIAVMPSLARDGAAIGERWARANTPRVLQALEARLKAEGLLPATANLR